MSSVPPREAERCVGEAPVSLDHFLASVEKRAFRTAQLSVMDADEAMDIVQDAMFALARHYGRRTAAEWAPLFWRILHRRITDWHRRNSRRITVSLPGPADADDPGNPLEDLLYGTEPGDEPPGQLQQSRGYQRILDCLARLPLRQRQVFMLRAWEELDVETTARVLEISTGSVKTHYARALAHLQQWLVEEGDYDG